MESARVIIKKLIKTMLCNAFSFHESFHDMKLYFDDCTAPIESPFHRCMKREKMSANSIALKAQLM